MMEVQTVQLLQCLQLLLQVSIVGYRLFETCVSMNADVSFFLNGRLLPNNSIVAPGDIGEGSAV